MARNKLTPEQKRARELRRQNRRMRAPCNQIWEVECPDISSMFGEGSTTSDKHICPMCKKIKLVGHINIETPPPITWLPRRILRGMARHKIFSNNVSKPNRYLSVNWREAAKHKGKIGHKPT